MFKLNFNFNLFGPRSSASTTTTPEQAQQKQVLVPDNKVIAISRAAELDDFVDVDLKKLSYAEVAALSRTVKISNYTANTSTESVKEIKVIDESELGADVSDCQMALALGSVSNSSTKMMMDAPVGTAAAAAANSSATTTADAENLVDSAIIEALAQNEMVIDTFYNDKGNRFPVKKHKKKVMQKKARRST